jgi:transposase
MSKDKEYVGIDISKDYFDVCYADGKHNQFENNKEGFSKFKKTISDNSHCVLWSKQADTIGGSQIIYLIKI